MKWQMAIGCALLLVLLVVFPVGAQEAVEPVSPIPAPGLPDDVITPELPVVRLNGNVVAMLISVLLTIALERVKGLSVWWDVYEYKSEFLLICGFFVVIGLLAGHYAGALVLEGVTMPFGWPVVWMAIEAYVQFALAGEITYQRLKSAGQLPRKELF